MRILCKKLTLCQKALRDAIKASKKTYWKEVRDKVVKDIWGKGYGTLKKKLIGFQPIRPQLSMEKMEQVVTGLFPTHDEVSFALLSEVEVRSQEKSFKLQSENSKIKKHLDQETSYLRY